MLWHVAFYEGFVKSQMQYFIHWSWLSMILWLNINVKGTCSYMWHPQLFPKLINISNNTCTVFPHVPPSVGGRLEGAGGIGHWAQADPGPQQSALPHLEREDKHDEDCIGKKRLQIIQTPAIQMINVWFVLSTTRNSTRLHLPTLCGLTLVPCGTLVSTTN